MSLRSTTPPSSAPDAEPDESACAAAPRRWVLPARCAAAAASGLVQLAALPPYGWWWLAPLSAAFLLLAVRGVRLRRAAWLGAVAGAALMVPLLHWQAIFGVDVWLVIAAAETLYFVPLAVGVALVLRLPHWPVWTAALWVAQEFIRARWPLGGFPWGKLAFSQPDTVFGGYAAWGSSALVTFAVALVGALLVAALLRVHRVRRPDARALGALAAIGAVLALGAVAPRAAAPHQDHEATMGIVQGNVPGVGEVSVLGERQEVLNNHLAGVHQIAEGVRGGDHPPPDMVILPENASDLDPYADPEVGELIQDAARDVEAPLVFGVSRHLEGDRREIQSVVWDPEDGPGDAYVKRYLVPFGEYIPYRDLFVRWISRLEQVGTDGVPGTEPGALDVGGTTLAAAICFDVAFDPPVREAVAEGGQILVVPTNNANYNFTGQTEQQLAITQLRAVEHGRPAVVASTSGISAVVAPDGTVTERSPEAEAWVHVEEGVPAMQGFTPATRLGVLPEAVLALLGVAAMATAGVLGRRARARGDDAGPTRGND